MNDVQLLEQLSLTDAYSPETDMPAAAWTRDATFNEIERLIDAQTSEYPRASLPRRRTGLLVAAAMFAAVLIVGIALVASLGTAPDIEPVTTLAPTTTTTVATTTTSGPTSTAAPTTTTTAEPEIDVGALAFIGAMVEELNSGDGEAAAQRVLSVENFNGPWFVESEGHNDERPLLASHLRLWAALDSVVRIDECATLTSGVTRCLISRSSEHDAFHPNEQRSIWQIRLEGDVAVFMNYDADFTDKSWTVQGQYEQWLNRVDRAAFNALIAVEDPAATAEIQKQYVAQWRAEQGADDSGATGDS